MSDQLYCLFLKLGLDFLRFCHLEDLHLWSVDETTDVQEIDAKFQRIFLARLPCDTPFRRWLTSLGRVAQCESWVALNGFKGPEGWRH